MTGPNDLYKFKALLLPWKINSTDQLSELILGTWPTAEWSSWHDGDTCNVIVSQGMRIHWLGHLRCAGYNAPELKTGIPGTQAAAYVRTLVDTGGIVYLDSLQFEPDEEDDFGRMLGSVTLLDGRDLTNLMISSGNAVAD